MKRIRTVDGLAEVAARLGITLGSLVIRLQGLEWEAGLEFPSDDVIMSTRDETGPEEATRTQPDDWMRRAGVRNR